MKLILFILSLLILNSIYSQEIKGIILSKETHTPINKALISVIDYEINIESDTTGHFSLQTNNEIVKVRIFAFGYKSQIITLTKNEFNKIELEADHIELEEMIVVANYRGTLQKNNITYIEAKKLADLKAIPGANLGEALSNIPGVYQSSTGIGISKPVIRGLQGIRVVTLLNGLRIENQQWGGDHGMGVSDLGIGSVEVIKGPASVLYGADAMGGVLYLSDEPYAKQNRQEIDFQNQFELNTMGNNSQLMYKFSKGKWKISTGGLYSNHADFQLPDGKYAKNSRFTEQAGKFNLGYSNKKWIVNLRYNYQQNIAGIPGHTHDSIINPLSFQVDKQIRKRGIPYQKITNHFASLENKWIFDKTDISLLTGHTFNNLTEHDEKITIPGISMNLNNSIANLRLKSAITENFTLLYGIQSMYQQNKNLPKASEALIPSSTTLDAGAYLTAIQDINKWSIQIGGRFDSRTINSLEKFNNIDPLTKTFTNINGAAGAVYNSKKSTFRFNFASGFRAPHLTELLANGFHHGTLRYEIGNINLVPEKANQIDATYEFHHEHAEIIINPFINNYNNFIYIEPSDSTIDGLPVYYYKQMNQAKLYGIDFGIHYHPHFLHNLHSETHFSYIKAEGENGRNLPMIPQTRINSQIKYLFNSKRKIAFEKITIQFQYYFAQNEISEFETKSASYHTLNFGTQIKIGNKNPWRLTFGVRNVTNQKYINHLSRLKNIEMPNPGAAIYFGIKYNFEKELIKNK